jgi:hypothetical protein
MGFPGKIDCGLIAPANVTDCYFIERHNKQEAITSPVP